MTRQASSEPTPGARSGAFALTAAIGTLHQRLSVERSSYAKAGLLAGLFQLGDPSALSGLARLLHSRQYHVRYYVGIVFAESASLADIDAARSELEAALRKDGTLAGIERALTRAA